MTAPDAPTLLEARSIWKSFPGVQALADVDLVVRPGEVIAVVGENGAGKSTLMKILAGVEGADTGTMLLDGVPYAPADVHDAIDRGVALIHQELNLAGNLDIAANIGLGREPVRWGLLDRGRLRERARIALQSIGLDEPPGRRVDDLSIGHRQLVEIAKALSINARVLIMDEPTSSLTHHETERLFGVIRNLKERGVAVIYISHRLAEVEQVAERVVVLRDGRLSGELESAEIERDRMMHLMVGRALSGYTRQAEPPIGDVCLAAREVRTLRFPTSSVSFEVRAGEVLGVAGLVGAGRTELLETIFGVRPSLGGVVAIDGRSRAIRRPMDAIGAGIALVPEDRQQYGLLLEEPVRLNIGIVELARQAHAGFVNRKRERAVAADIIRQLAVRCTGGRQIVQTLSGGNQQKVVLGKWLTVRPQVLLLDEPTRGVDVGARAEIYRIIEMLAEQGTGIVLASSDLEEVLAMSDRVMVMRDGEVAGFLERRDLSETAVMRLATNSERAA